MSLFDRRKHTYTSSKQTHSLHHSIFSLLNCFFISFLHNLLFALICHLLSSPSSCSILPSKPHVSISLFTHLSLHFLFFCHSVTHVHLFPISLLAVLLFIFPFDLLLCILDVSLFQSLSFFPSISPPLYSHHLVQLLSFLWFFLSFHCFFILHLHLVHSPSLPLISEQTAGFDEGNVNVRSYFCRGRWASQGT